MEPSVSTLFDHTLDCFDYIQLGRNCGRDVQTNLLKLDDARLRLSRWGESVGIKRDGGEVAKSATSRQRVDRRLKHLIGLFKTAERISNQFKQDAAPEDSSLLLFDAETDFTPSMATLHHTMRDLSIERRSPSRAGLQRSLKWAIYEENHFNQLIKDIIDVVDGLVELFPAALDEQRRLCELEAAVGRYRTGGNESLRRLKSIVAGQDPHLEAAIAKAIEGRNGHSYENVRGSDQARMMLGDSDFNGAQASGNSHTYTNVVGSGNAVMHLGNSNRDKSIFD